MLRVSALVAVRVLGELLFLYGLLGWVYGVLVQLTHPYWLSYWSFASDSMDKSGHFYGVVFYRERGGVFDVAVG